MARVEAIPKTPETPVATFPVATLEIIPAVEVATLTPILTEFCVSQFV